MKELLKMPFGKGKFSAVHTREVSEAERVALHNQVDKFMDEIAAGRGKRNVNDNNSKRMKGH